ncbi:MAG: haloacid dehalogenase type II [Legionellaceae bacterium]|nr:haloacid dehalogenase type II [Legionellaceae bacterium]
MLRIIYLYLTLSICSYLEPSPAIASNLNTPIKAVLFDVFGTVVDWHGTMTQEFDVLFQQKKITTVSSEAFVESWVEAYSQNMSNISEGNAPFETVDVLNQIALDDTLKTYHLLEKFTENERITMWMIWHRLAAWPDSSPGISTLKKQFIIGTLSNGNVKLLIDLSKRAELDWDVILSGELIGHYKPNPIVYQNAAKILNLNPSEILLVASHKYDLEAARRCGYKTAYIFRPLEYGSQNETNVTNDDEFDFVTTSIEELAEILGNASMNDYHRFNLH